MDGGNSAAKNRRMMAKINLTSYCGTLEIKQ
jgi:hypothetical protein